MDNQVLTNHFPKDTSAGIFFDEPILTRILWGQQHNADRYLGPMVMFEHGIYALLLEADRTELAGQLLFYSERINCALLRQDEVGHVHGYYFNKLTDCEDAWNVFAEDLGLSEDNA